MLGLVLLTLGAVPPLPPDCAQPELHDVAELKVLSQQSGALSVGLDSIATWCFDSSGAWTGGQPVKPSRPADPNAIPSGDCARAVASCLSAQAALSRKSLVLLDDALADLKRPYRGQSYTPRRSGLGDRPNATFDCRGKDRAGFFAQAQARMDYARISTQTMNEYAGYKSWLLTQSLRCSQEVRRGQKDGTRRTVTVEGVEDRAPDLSGGVQPDGDGSSRPGGHVRPGVQVTLGGVAKTGGAPAGGYAMAGSSITVEPGAEGAAPGNTVAIGSTSVSGASVGSGGGRGVGGSGAAGSPTGTSGAGSASGMTGPAAGAGAVGPGAAGSSRGAGGSGSAVAGGTSGAANGSSGSASGSGTGAMGSSSASGAGAGAVGSGTGASGVAAGSASATRVAGQASGAAGSPSGTSGSGAGALGSSSGASGPGAGAVGSVGGAGGVGAGSAGAARVGGAAGSLSGAGATSGGGPGSGVVGSVGGAGGVAAGSVGAARVGGSAGSLSGTRATSGGGPGSSGATTSAGSAGAVSPAGSAPPSAGGAGAAGAPGAGASVSAGASAPGSAIGSGATTSAGSSGGVAGAGGAAGSTPQSRPAALERWRAFAARRQQMEADRDYTLGFLSSHELRDCRCQRPMPSLLVQALESGAPAPEALDDKVIACEQCVEDSFGVWRTRATKQCALALKLSDYELGYLERSDDGNGLPPRCLEEAKKNRPAAPAAPAPAPTAPQGKSNYVVTKLDQGDLTTTAQGQTDAFVRPRDYAPIPEREEGRLYVRIFMSSACVAEILPGPMQARTGDLLIIPYGARSLSVRSPCGGLAEVYWGREPKPRVSEIFGKHQPLQLEFRPQ